MRRFVLLLAVLPMLACPPAWGTEFRSGGIVTVPAQEVVEDDLVVAGQNVLVEGTVVGDLVVAGQSVSIPGKVLGSVIAVGREVDVPGDVRGSVAAAGQNVTLSGNVGRNAAAGAANVVVSSTSVVRRDLHVGAQSMILGGRVGRDVNAAGAAVKLGGIVGRRALLHAQQAQVSGKVDSDLRFEGQSLALEPGARVGGDVYCRAPKPPTIASTATVVGAVEQLKPRVAKAPKKRGPFLPAALLFLVVFVNGAIGLAAAPRLFVASANAVGVRPWWSLFIGFLTLVIVPLAAIVVCLTLIGLPVGLLALALWGLALLLSGVPVGTFIGKALLGSLGVGRPVSPYWALLLGLAVLTVAGLIPILGTITKVLTVLLGVGVLARAGKGLVVEMRAPAR